MALASPVLASGFFITGDTWEAHMQYYASVNPKLLIYPLTLLVILFVFAMSLICFCFVYKFVCMTFLDSMYKWYHMIFVLLTYLV